MKILKFKLVVCTLLALLSSCGYDSMPQDLEIRKENINETLDVLSKEGENVTNSKDLLALIEKYIALRNEIVNYTEECNNRGIVKNNDEAISSVNQVIVELQSKIPVSISYTQAKSFMQNRCNEIGRTLMDGKTIYFNKSKLFYFLTVAENGYVCISAVPERSLEVLVEDCGPFELKMEQWNALISN